MNPMTSILALDTSTDACSAALQRGEQLESRYQLLPRKHNHLLFTMLGELLPDGAQAAGLDLLAYGQGPGSFTGLRIAASAVQGLAYTLELPVAGISTLACLAQGAMRRGVVSAEDRVLVLIDARINEVYWGYYGFDDGLATALVPDQVSAPGDLPADLMEGNSLALGSGLAYFEALPSALQAAVASQVADQWPDSRDLIPLARRAEAAGELVSAQQVQPVYLRNEIHWKKLSEQGPAA
jgi:tRNA threonylcarbamoyladenosine biosynthesis protein TsaB